jgi:hypothetical protein
MLAQFCIWLEPPTVLAMPSVVTFHVYPNPPKGEIALVHVTEGREAAGMFEVTAGVWQRVRDCFTPDVASASWTILLLLLGKLLPRRRVRSGSGERSAPRARKRERGGNLGRVGDEGLEPPTSRM